MNPEEMAEMVCGGLSKFRWPSKQITVPDFPTRGETASQIQNSDNQHGFTNTKSFFFSGTKKAKKFAEPLCCAK